jgi:hypothetical protein
MCASLTYARGYHSTAILLADGSVLVGGDQPPCTLNRSGETTPNERYFPSYFTQPRPVITAAPSSVNHGATFTVQTPNPAAVAEVVLMRPGAVTHGFNMSQRMIECVIASRTATNLHVQAPPDGTVAPPGWYLLFLVDTARVPSTGNWMRLTP